MEFDFLTSGLLLVFSGIAMNAMKAVPGKVFNALMRLISFQVECPDHEPSYQWMKEFLPDQEYAYKVRSVSIAKKATKAGVDRWYFVPAPGVHWFWFRGHLVSATRSRSSANSPTSDGRFFYEHVSIRIFFGGEAIASQMIEEAKRRFSRNDGLLPVYTASRWGGWNQPEFLPARPLASVILGEGLKEDICRDIEEFRKARDWYTGLGIPYRRGYLFHGAPGNGKTSLIKSLAAHYGFGLAVVSLNETSLTDSSLIQTFSSLPSKTCLLIEDVDCMFKENRNGDASVTFSGFLNAIDGAASKDDRLLFMTTNHLEKLDQALIRPGRCDRIFEIPNATRPQIEAYFRHFFGGDHLHLAPVFASKFAEGQVSMARLQEICIENRVSPEGLVK